MNKDQEGVIRYVLINEDPVKIAKPMFSLERRFGEEGYRLPLPPATKMRIHDAITTAADFDVVRSIILGNGIHIANFDEFRSSALELNHCINELTNRLESQIVNNETIADVFNKNIQLLDNIRQSAEYPIRQTADFAYKFGFSTAVKTFRKEATGIEIPKLTTVDEMQELPIWQNEIAKIAGYHTEWCALSSFDNKGFDYRNNPFAIILEMVENGAANIHFDEEGTLSYTLRK